MKYTGKKVDNGQTVTGNYIRVDMTGCWIGCKEKSGYWESKVDASTVQEIPEDEES